MQLTQRELNKLDAFQLRNVRRILKIPPIFVDRTQTNEKVRDRDLEYGLQVEKVSITWKQATIKLLGHTIRTHRHDPLRQVFFEKGTNTPKIYHCKRVGRPRAEWVSETMKDSLYALGQPIPQYLSDENIQMICEAARDRKEPFD